jgi:hypothetical protein
VRCALTALTLLALAAAARADVADPPPVRFPEQAPPLGPRTLRVTADTAIVRDIGGEVRNGTLVVEALGRRGGWVYGLQIGTIMWTDRYTVISEHRANGWQPTNPIVTVAYWGTPGRAKAGSFQVGLHMALMLGIIGGPPSDSDGVYEYEKRPSMLARFTAVPYTVPDETAGELGLTMRYDDGVVMAQAEAAIVGIHGRRGTDSDTPNHGWFAAGLGVRVHPMVVLAAHGFLHRGKRAYNPFEHRYAVGGAIHVERNRQTVSLRIDQRLDACHVGWFPDDDTGLCTRVVLDYARPF